ncbi:hypothetical protein [Nitrosococcus oceani]|uniref:hypothetical protein n=1 Tax=Nitrosococcus oceani TaxID=1229 RepID=UPI000A55D6EF|nr:hypothetical protein [Nitrosococcus oceani]
MQQGEMLISMALVHFNNNLAKNYAQTTIKAAGDLSIIINKALPHQPMISLRGSNNAMV